MCARALLLALAVLALVAAPAAAQRPEPTLVPDSELPGASAFLGPVRTVPVNGVELGFRRFGSGPDLVLVMGDTGTMSLWTPYLLRPLARSFRVTIFDNRGVGYSTDDPSVRLSIPLMARDTAGLLEALGMRDATVVGWSMGGEIAVSMAALRLDERVGRIVTSGGDAGGRRTIPPPPGIISKLADPATGTQTALEIMFPDTPAGRTAQQRFVDAYIAIPQETPSPQILDRQAAAERAFLRTERVWNRLGRVRVPALITNGALDPAVPVGNARRLARRIPGARLSIFQGAMHGMMFQDADRFADEVRAFWRRTR